MYYKAAALEQTRYRPNKVCISAQTGRQAKTLANTLQIMHI
ncbi:hypothetical protein [Marinagarivorans cellulosilyticus]|nr:hypothetical protein [Marinagarivorans cellulosilyticus]